MNFKWIVSDVISGLVSLWQLYTSLWKLTPDEITKTVIMLLKPIFYLKLEAKSVKLSVFIL